MKISIVHNVYQQRGGEDAVVVAESELLISAGHEVGVSFVSNDDIKGFRSKFSTLLQTPYSSFGKDFMSDLIKREQPDVVHIHNFFPRLSPSAHEAASRAGIPVVQTLHNYRLFCAGAKLLREGKYCEKCVTGPRIWGAIHRCYRDSFPGSAALVGMQWNADWRQTWNTHVTRFIALTETSKAAFVRAGLHADQISVKPNFCKPMESDTHSVRAGCLFVGRISEEKGLRVAIQAFAQMPDIELTVIGDGPDRMSLQRISTSNIKFIGAQSPAGVADAMSAASVLIMPAIWREPFGMTLIEALAAGTPIIASNIGAIPEIVENEKTGLLFEPGSPSSLRDAVLTFFGKPAAEIERMRGAAASVHRIRFSPQSNLSQLESIYRAAISQKNAGLLISNES